MDLFKAAERKKEKKKKRIIKTNLQSFADFIVTKD
jgi:hypothetical protein